MANLVRSVLLPVLLVPAQLGIWNLMNVVIGYGANAHLGLLHGLNKRVPALRATDAAAELDQLKDSVLWVCLALALLLGAGLFASSFVVAPAHGAPLRIVAVVVVLQMAFVYYFCLLRGDNRFGEVSAGMVLSAVASCAAVLGLAYVSPDPLHGALWGLAAAYPLVLGYWYLRGGYKFSLALEWSQVKAAFALGLPLIVLGFMDMIFLSLDRWIIAAQLSDAVLGFYALGSMASNLLGLVPNSVSNVLFPRMVQRFAVSGDNAATSALILLPARAISALMLFVTSGMAIALPVVIRLALPKYAPAIPLIQIIVPGAFFLSLAYSVGNYVVAVNRQRALISTLAIAICVTLALDLIALRLGWGAEGVAAATVAGYSIYGLSYLGIAVHLAKNRWRETLAFVFSHIGLFALMAIALSRTVAMVPADGGWGAQLGRAVVRFAVVSCALVPGVWLANRRSGVWNALYQGFLGRRDIAPLT